MLDVRMQRVADTRTLPTRTPARSLSWSGDVLVDWVSGHQTWTLDGEHTPSRVSWGNGRFGTAVTDPSGRWVVIHERTGTSGVLVRDGTFVRELHRSWYHADAYAYPVCLFPGPDGRTLLAHCPDSYARIDIDDAETGERLTRGVAREPSDFFHSRLAVSPGGRRLMSAGWVWHPWDAVVWFDLAEVLRDPTRLDALHGTSTTRNVCLVEESSAAWVDDDRLLIGSSSEEEDPEEAAEADRDHPGPRLRPRGLAVYDLRAEAYTVSVPLDRPPGIMMPVGDTHVVTFFETPRLIAVRTGRIVHEWPQLRTGEDVSSIVWRRRSPPLALDPTRRRFAVASDDAIEVVTLEPGALPE